MSMELLLYYAPFLLAALICIVAFIKILTVVVITNSNDNEVYIVKGNKYGFSYKFSVRDKWRAYITDIPSLKGRSTRGEIIHILCDKANAPYVCWTDPLQSKRDAKAVAHHWADCLQNYIQTGVFSG